MKQEYDIQSAYKYANVKEGSENSQVVQHVGHVPPVIEGVAVGLLSLLHLALVLQHVPQVPPGCRGNTSVSGSAWTALLYYCHQSVSSTKSYHAT